jgi:spermidine synthase
LLLFHHNRNKRVSVKILASGEESQTPPITGAAARRARAAQVRRLVGLCFVLSGAAGLIYEVLWMRMLGLVFGATTFAASTVLAAFMGGLALGSWWAGKRAAKLANPLRVYGWVEIAVAVYALAVPFLFRAIDALYPALWTRWQGSFLAFSLLRFLLASLVLLAPTALMGATLPVLAEALARAPGFTPGSVTRLYSFNLAGAIIGTLAAGFALLPALGARGTVIFAAGLNVAVGVFALWLAGRYRADEGAATQETATDGENAETYNENALPAGFWLLAALTSGFVTIAAQVVWMRLLSLVIGSSAYAFSVVVALFLLGLMLGARFVGRGFRDLPRAVLWVELATAASLCFSLVVVNRAPGLLIGWGLKLGLASWPGLLALQVAVAALLVLLPAFLMGMVMPLVLVWAGGAAGDAARRVGLSYAVNTFGAIAGAFLAGFFLIPKASTRFTLLLAATLCVAVAGLAYRPRGANADVGLHRSLALGAGVALVVLMFLLTPFLNLPELSVGAYDGLTRVLARSRFGGGEGETQKAVTQYRLLAYEEGPTATVSVGEADGVKFMSVNGRTNASDKEDMPTQIMVGQLPLLIASRAEKNLMIGYASGVSVGAMLASDIPSLECVELEPATVKLSRFFGHANNKPLTDKRLQLINDDARAYLRVSPARYDVIVSEPSHPWVPGVANLFTRDFFEIGRQRLADDGVFTQWVQIYQLSPDSLRSVLATFHSVFPHVLMFRVGGANEGKDLILLGSNRPLNLSRLDERLKNPRHAAELARVKMDTRAAVEAWYICDEKILGPAVSGAPLNTDDNMLIEHRAPREAFKPLMEENSRWIASLKNIGLTQAGKIE